jgi:uncharacterized protein (TIGR00290 family)
VKKRVLLSWSSGKDSAWALHTLRQTEVDVVGLFTTVNAEYERVAMHGVRLELLQRQAEAIGLPLSALDIPHPCSNAEYASVMGAFVGASRKRGIDFMAFGDLFLRDIRDYREAQLRDTGIAALFPLWNRPTGPLARQMVTEGLRAVITCVDPRQLPARYAGRQFDERLLDELSDAIDPCGENGEFHTFVTDGPMFKRPVDVRIGDIVEREGFVFADLLPSWPPVSEFPSVSGSPRC